MDTQTVLMIIELLEDRINALNFQNPQDMEQEIGKEKALQELRDYLKLYTVLKEN